MFIKFNFNRLLKILLFLICHFKIKGMELKIRSSKTFGNYILCYRLKPKKVRIQSREPHLHTKALRLPPDRSQVANAAGVSSSQIMADIQSFPFSPCQFSVSHP